MSEDSELFLNPEFSWFAFNERVLNEAQSLDVPLLERLKFCLIAYSNLDEFFMVRLSNLLHFYLQRIKNTQEKINAEKEVMDQVFHKVSHFIAKAEIILHEDILVKLASKGIQLTLNDNLNKAEEERLEEHFKNQVLPVLTPLAVDPAHPFPYLSNLSSYLAVSFEDTAFEADIPLAIIEIPPKISRLIQISVKKNKYHFFPVEQLIKKYLDQIFPWLKTKSAYIFRVTRHMDYQLLESEVTDLLKSVETEIKDRAQKFVVRLEYEQSMPPWLVNYLKDKLDLTVKNLYCLKNGLVAWNDLYALIKCEGPFAALRDPPFNPRIHPTLAQTDKNIFEILTEKNVLLHHPYDSFAAVLDFLHSAAHDPNVLAIKQTLYRSGGDSPIVESLITAAKKGKQVTVLIELKARFDEVNNIGWAKRLENAGAHVVFGFINLKTHAKCCLVIRREKDQNLRRYVHLSTGNYNSTTAKNYSDIGLLSSDPVLGEDLSQLFNFLTGFNILRQDILKATPPELEKIHIAPFRLREYFLSLIENEIKVHTSENPGHIILKMNALVDIKLCQALFKASQKGIKINLIVRSECILRPGIPGFSENIQVISIIDRFLEHSRIFWFKNGGNPKIYCGSADFMPRNMDRRVELIWSVEQKEFQEIITKILHSYLKDNQKSHQMLFDGTYEKVIQKNEKSFRSQEYFIEKTRKYGIKSLNYDHTTKTSHFQFQDNDLIEEYERLLPRFIAEDIDTKKKNKR